MYRSWSLTILAGLLSTACSQSFLGEGNEGADAGSEDPSLISNPVDAGLPPAEPVDITLRSTETDSIVPLNSISCNSGDPTFFHAENRYFRVLDMAAAGVAGDFVVSSVDLGIEQAVGANGTQDIVVSLHSLEGTLEAGSKVQLVATTVPVSDQNETIINVPMAATVPSGSKLVVEVLTPDGQPAGNKFFVGSNREAESSPTYILAPTCSVNAPVPIATLGIQDLIMSMVVNVNGQHIP